MNVLRATSRYVLAVSVVADPEAISFIADHGGRLYVWADQSDLKHVKTEPPDDPSIAFAEIKTGSSFRLYVASDIEQPETWNVVFRHLPTHHIDVLWDGHQPGTGHAFPVPPP